MAVARKPAGKPARDTEAAAERFIKGAVRAVPPPPPSHKTPVMMRFDAGLLARVDGAAKRRGISRSAWIAYTVSAALDAEGSRA